MTALGGMPVVDLRGVKLGGSVTHKVKTVDKAAYELRPDDYELHVDYTATGAVTITIPDGATHNWNGRHVRIIDTGFTAGTNNITITCSDATEKINNSTGDYVITGNGNAIDLVGNGTHWFIN